jgi:hypothetical protein
MSRKEKQKIMKKLLIILLVLIGGVITSKAQDYFQLQMGLGFPNDDFADDDYDDAIFDGAGFASTGVNLGLKHYSSLDTEGLSWVIGINIFYNPLSTDFKDEIEDESSGDITFLKYINIPVMAGLNYKIPVDESLALYGEGSLGINTLKITNFSIDGNNSEATLTFTPSFKLSYAIGMGVWIQDKYSIGLNYYGLGSHKCKYKIKATYDGGTERDNDKFDRALDISIISLAFGINL